MNWRPADAVEVDLSLDWTRKREESSGTTLLAVDPGTFDGGGNLVSGISAFVNNVFFPPALSDPDQFTFDSRWITGDPYTNFADGSRSKSDLDLFGVGATIAVSAADWLDIKSITAFRMADSDNDRDGDASPTVILHPATRIDQQQFSQELQFSGNAANGRVNWLVGGFFLYEDINFFAPVDIAFVYIDNSAIVTTESWAGFAQASFDLFDGLSITPGMRYTYETKTNEPIIITTGPDFFNPVGPPPGTVLLIDDASASFDEFTPAVSIDYRWSDALLTYASWSKGFKSGGFSQRIAFPRAESPSFNPEKVSSWEVGFKFDGFDRRFRLNAAAFLANYTDLQVVVFNQVEPLNENAGEARIKGIELEATFVASHFLTLSGGFGYTDAKYTEVRDPRALLSLDDELAYTPEWTGNVSAVLNYPVERLKGDIIGRVDWSYRSEVYFDALNTPELLQEAYSLVNLNIGYENIDWGLKILVGATNLTNEKYIIAGFADLITSSLVDATFARPREWYLTVKKSL
ncbi:MAG: TonB-dependent receptor [Sphingomonadales bacterium]|nr:TonB-dependent receptor [Sphingomonadales bacterium]